MKSTINNSGSASLMHPAQREETSWLDTTPSQYIGKMLHRIGASQRQRAQDASHLVPALEQENTELREKLETLTHREANARYLATHDGLTGLANRSLLMDRFIQAAAHARRNERSVALMVFDINGFKAINDNHGHASGDRLLQQMGHELEATARAGDTACRYGGDEFVLLLASIDCIEDARLVADNVRARTADLLRKVNIPVDVSASCGIAMYPDDGDNWHRLMEAADLAMYKDKPQSTRSSVDADQRPQRSHARQSCGGTVRTAIGAASEPLVSGNHAAPLVARAASAEDAATSARQQQ